MPSSSPQRQQGLFQSRARKEAVKHPFVRMMYIALLTLPACATPPRMHLSTQSPQFPGRLAWWTLADPEQIHPPIIAIEYRVDPTITRQYVFCDRGLRVFTYDRDRLTRSSPPLPAPGAPPDPIVIRAALRELLQTMSTDPNNAASPIPDDQITAVTSPTNLIALLHKYWPAARVEPTIPLTHRQLDAELQHFAHGALELNDASKAF